MIVSTDPRYLLGVPYPSPSSLIMRYALPLILRFELGIQQPIKDENASRIELRNDMMGARFEEIKRKKEMKCSISC